MRAKVWTRTIALKSKLLDLKQAAPIDIPDNGKKTAPTRGRDVLPVRQTTRRSHKAPHIFKQGEITWQHALR